MGNRLWLFSASPSSFFPLSHTGSEALSSSQGHSREHSSTWSHALGQGGPHPQGLQLRHWAGVLPWSTETTGSAQKICKAWPGTWQEVRQRPFSGIWNPREQGRRRRWHWHHAICPRGLNALPWSQGLTNKFCRWDGKIDSVSKGTETHEGGACGNACPKQGQSLQTLCT